MQFLLVMILGLTMLVRLIGIYEDILRHKSAVASSWCKLDAMMKEEIELADRYKDLILKESTAVFDVISENELLTVQDQLAALENKRRDVMNHYNEAVRAYNHALVKFPNSMITKMFHFEERSLLQDTKRIKAKISEFRVEI